MEPVRRYEEESSVQTQGTLERCAESAVRQFLNDQVGTLLIGVKRKTPISFIVYWFANDPTTGREARGLVMCDRDGTYLLVLKRTYFPDTRTWIQYDTATKQMSAYTHARGRISGDRAFQYAVSAAA